MVKNETKQNNEKAFSIILSREKWIFLKTLSMHVGLSMNAILNGYIDKEKIRYENKLNKLDENINV